MSVIVWDAVGEKKYETGTNHGVLYLPNESGIYDTGVAWNGLTGVDENPDGAEANDIYADNIKYASLRSAETFKFTINAFTHPDEFYECDGSAEVASGAYIGQQKRKPFGFSYRTEIGDDLGKGGYKVHLVYGCTASPSDKSYETVNDSPDAITFSWEVDTVPVNVTDHEPSATLIVDSTKVTKEKMKALEDILYGTSTTEPKLPTPDEVIALLSAA